MVTLAEIQAQHRAMQLQARLLCGALRGVVVEKIEHPRHQALYGIRNAIAATAAQRQVIADQPQGWGAW